MRLGNANEDMKYISMSNSHIKLEESKYDSQTHRTANLNHLGKGLAPQNTQFLEASDEDMEILRNAK